MVPVVVPVRLAPETRVNAITKAQRRRLLEVLKGFRVDIAGPRPVSETIVTSAGWSVGQINPKRCSPNWSPACFLRARSWM
jgi:predicted flavoprotein YhiN